MIQEGAIYFNPADTKIPLRATGHIESVEKDASTTFFVEYQEVITKENRNWCKGEVVLSSIPMGLHPDYN